jgi:hypothetical protein
MKLNKILFIGLFTLLGLMALQVPFTTVLGSNVKFTLFDFLAPTAGAFLGTAPGIISVLLMQIINVIIHGGRFTEIAGFIRLFPILMGVFYFSKSRKINVLFPILAIIAFNLHPIGRSAWQYSMFWLIPVAAHFFRKNLFLRSLGATFAAHSLGGALWVWAFGLSREMWLTLIPQTMMERLLMAGGICLFYLLFANLWNLARQKKLVPEVFQLEKKYLLN